MKHWIILILLIMPIKSTLLAQSPIDSSSSFEDQRQRVNRLLDERNRKFGEYDLSLQQKTGIFGLFKSKNDMQHSIDILKQIVITDNNIFLETRKLLQLKDSEKEQYQRLAQEYDQQVTAYMKTISKLQQENERLKDEIKRIENEEHSSSAFLYLFIAISILLLGVVIYLYMTLKTKNVTKV